MRVCEWGCARIWVCVCVVCECVYLGVCVWDREVVSECVFFSQKKSHILFHDIN